MLIYSSGLPFQVLQPEENHRCQPSYYCCMSEMLYHRHVLTTFFGGTSLRSASQFQSRLFQRFCLLFCYDWTVSMNHVLWSWCKVLQSCEKPCDCNFFQVKVPSRIRKPNQNTRNSFIKNVIVNLRQRLFFLIPVWLESEVFIIIRQLFISTVFLVFALFLHAFPP